MRQRGNRAERKFPLKAEHDIGKNQQQREDHRESAFFGQLFTNLRTDKFHATQFNIRLVRRESIA